MTAVRQPAPCATCRSKLSRYASSTPTRMTHMSDELLRSCVRSWTAFRSPCLARCLPQFREFERTIATTLNAYVMPQVSRYLTGLESAAKRDGMRAPLFIMKSNGGVTSADLAARQAIHTVLSGPVAGVMGATRVSGDAGLSQLHFGRCWRDQRGYLPCKGRTSRTSQLNAA